MDVQAAQIALEQLRADPAAPAKVLEAAEEAVYFARCGITPPMWCYQILMDFAAGRQAQNRYGH